MQWDPASAGNVATASLVGITIEGSQTVPRAELTAGAKAPDLLRLRPSQVQRWVVNASYVCNGAIQTVSSPPAVPGAHADLWAEVDFAMHESVLPVPSKVTSHLGLKQVVDGAITFKDYFANGLADAAAGAMDALVGPAHHDLQHAEDEERIGVHIALRLAAVEWLSWHIMSHSEELEVTLPAIPAVSTWSVHAARLWDKIAETGHILESHRTTKGTCCTRCKVCGLSVRKAKLDTWLRNPCAPLGLLSSTGAILAEWEAPQAPDRNASEEEPDIAIKEKKVVGSLTAIKAASKVHSLARKTSARLDATQKDKAAARVQ